MHKIIPLFIGLSSLIGCGYQGRAVENVHEDIKYISWYLSKNGYEEGAELSDEKIKEIERLTDSIKVYGFREGVRRYHKDSIQISEEDSVMLMNILHEVLESNNELKSYYYEQD